jgi:hypothetical protein
VTLPDADVISELAGRGDVFRTDVNDAACAANPAKVGPDNDGKRGGCTNIRLRIGATPTVQLPIIDGGDT